MAELIRENTTTPEEIKVPSKKAPELGYFSRFLINIVKTGKIPKSVAFIMDGNRRFASN